MNAGWRGETADAGVERSSPTTAPHVTIPLNLRSHQLLVGSANSVRLPTVSRSLEPGLHLALAQSRHTLDATGAAREHRALLETIRHGRFEDVRDALNKHLRDAGNQVAALLP